LDHRESKDLLPIISQEAADKASAFETARVANKCPLFTLAAMWLVSGSPMTTKAKPAGADVNFETAMDRLEKIVEQMESGQLPLEDLIVRYEEGMNLVKVCQERLASAEQKIEIIARNSAGKASVKDFASAAEIKTESEITNAGDTHSDEVRLF
jgi:exodeoxyribonuclease VII small subunit